MQILNFIAQTLLGELLVVIAGVLFAYGIKRQYDNWRYGRWRIHLIHNNQLIVNRPISPRKAHDILDEPADLAVFLKGVASPYEWITCDILSVGEKVGLLTIDRPQRLLIINLDNNPPPQGKPDHAPRQL